MKMPQDNRNLSRRGLLAGAGATLAAAALAGRIQAAEEKTPEKVIHNDHIRQTMCKWCWPKWSMEEACRNAAALGMGGIDLVGPDSFATIKKYNLTATTLNTHPIPTGLNRKQYHPMCLEKIRNAIEAAAENGSPNVICFSGNRSDKTKGAQQPAEVSAEEGMKTCAEALKEVVGLAEQKKVTIIMELLNSRVNHKDYMCDNTPWGVALCKMVGSERFRLLFDIYHMGIMGEDVIAMIKEHHPYFAHYHTAGVPGRHEIDDSQTLKYPAIMRAIVDTGYKGWVGQEFIPTKDPLASLAQACKICDV